MHSIFIPTFPHGAGEIVHIAGDEAKHAVRSKRLEVGAAVQLLDGKGCIALAVIHAITKDKATGWGVDLVLEEVTRHETTQPAMHVVASGAKGTRLEHMVDGLSQVGATSFRSLVSVRTVVEPREGKLDRLRRVAEESCKQSGRAWLMHVGDVIHFDSIAAAYPGTNIVLADMTGCAYRVCAQDSTSQSTVLLIGPEGGWEPRELEYAHDQGWAIVSFGCHTMRIETAAVAAASIILDHHAQME